MRDRREKVKLRLKGKDVVEIIWSRQIRMVFLVHLVLRFIIEICFFYGGFAIQGKWTKKS